MLLAVAKQALALVEELLGRTTSSAGERIRSTSCISARR